MTLIAQITDLHIRPSGKKAYGVVDTEAMLRAAVDSILAQPKKPDAVIASGDLTDCGLVEEYELLRDCLKPLPMPVYLIPGNHDRRENMRLVFGDDGYLPMNGEFLHYTVEDLPLRLIGLDTVVPGKGHGEMDAPRLALAQGAARRAARPADLRLHASPALPDRPAAHGSRSTAATPSDGRAGEALSATSSASPAAIITARSRSAGPAPSASVAPSVAHQVVLDLMPHDDATFTMEPPGYHLHLWAPDTRHDHPHRLHRQLLGPAPLPARSRLSGVRRQGSRRRRRTRCDLHLHSHCNARLLIARPV